MSDIKNGKNYSTLITLGGALLLGFNIAVSLFGSVSIKERLAVLETRVTNLKESIDSHISRTQ